MSFSESYFIVDYIDGIPQKPVRSFSNNGNLFDEACSNDKMFKLYKLIKNYIFLKIRQLNLFDVSKQGNVFRISFSSDSIHTYYHITEILLDEEIQKITIKTVGETIPKERVVEFVYGTREIVGIEEYIGRFVYKNFCFDVSKELDFDEDKLIVFLDDHFKSFSKYHSSFIECIKKNIDFSKIGD